MKAWIGAVALVGVLASGGAMAATGNELLEWCKSVDNPISKGAFTSGYCLGTMVTVREMMVGYSDVLPAEVRACIPVEVTNGQAVKVTMKYMQENPEELHLSGVMLTVMAMKHAYPCKK